VRQRLIVGNWKMHKTATEAGEFVRQFTALMKPATSAPAVEPVHAVEIVLAPPFTALAAVRDAMQHARRFGLGAQNLFWEDKGAFTGEVSAPMLKDLGCEYIIIGHSERRQHFGETEDSVNKKVKAVLRHGLRPILCLGESLAQREQGQTEEVVTSQLQKGLKDVPRESIRQIVIAYEPVWAIGTGKAATPEQAVQVHRHLRLLLDQQGGPGSGSQIRILYGGSVTADNAGSFLKAPDIDGALVGGACLDPQSFARIVTFTA
jgi:triosephosphate isomerase (TIM)